MLEPQAMNLILQTQLLPDGDQARKLSATMRAFNAAADWLAGEAFRLKNANKVELQQLYYNQLRDDFGISAQMAIRCIAQVCEAYKRDKSIRPRFKKYARLKERIQRRIDEMRVRPTATPPPREPQSH